MPADPVVRHLEPAGHALPLPKVVPLPLLRGVLRPLRHAHVRVLTLLRAIYMKELERIVVILKTSSYRMQCI